MFPCVQSLEYQGKEASASGEFFSVYTLTNVLPSKTLPGCKTAFFLSYIVLLSFYCGSFKSVENVEVAENSYQMLELGKDGIHPCTQHLRLPGQRSLKPEHVKYETKARGTK
ncbi:unnamed protein product [Porites evermanni]|uniref:Uncharacterized protein n=1 Tax=Porites evermanni TaxID=104178 RepID=A0ABN8LMM5_9CNID|nr:unnamed protein product [Porites evermanni]